MAAPVAAGMPADLDLGDGWTIRLTALDPATGATISTVKVLNLRLGVFNVGGTSDGQLAVGDFQLVPGPGA